MISRYVWMKQEFLSLNIYSSVAETKVTAFLKNYTAPASFSFMLLDLEQKQMEAIWGPSWNRYENWNRIIIGC